MPGVRDHPFLEDRIAGSYIVVAYREIFMVRLCLLLFCLSLPLLSQTLYKETYEKQFLDNQYPQKVPVLFRPWSVPEGDSLYKVYLIGEIGHNFLQFIREGDHYIARARLEVMVRNGSDGFGKSRIWNTETTTTRFRDTTDPNISHTSLDSLILPPGNYEFLVNYQDLNGQRQLAYTRKLQLPERSGSFDSPPLFFYPTHGEDLFSGPPAANVSPLQGHWDFNRDLGIYLRCQLAADSMAVRVRAILMNTDTREKIFEDDQRDLRGPVVTLSLVIPAEKLQEASHRLKVIYYHGEDSTRSIVPFKVVWFNKPKSLWDRNLSIWPLRHILSEGDYQTLAEGNQGAQESKFKAFWKSMDRTPETPYNELQREFYARVDTTLIRYSNRRKQGWDTDPGKIYIAMGPPDQVEDHSLDPGPDPYLRWIYARDGKQLVYTFLAVDGRREYKLIDATEVN